MVLRLMCYLLHQTGLHKLDQDIIGSNLTNQNVPNFLVKPIGLYFVTLVFIQYNYSPKKLQYKPQTVFANIKNIPTISECFRLARTFKKFIDISTKYLEYLISFSTLSQ